MKKIIFMFLVAAVLLLCVACKSSSHKLQTTDELVGDVQDELSEDSFIKVVESYGYTTSMGDDGEIDAKKGSLSSISFHKYESVEKSNEVYKEEHLMFMDLCTSLGYKSLSYGERSSGVEADSLIMLTAHKDNMSIICIADASHKAEIEEILEDLGCI